MSVQGYYTFPKKYWSLKDQYFQTWINFDGPVKYVFCNTNVDNPNCIFYGAGDQLINGTMQNDIIDALGNWQTANANSNNSGISYVMGNSTGYFDNFWIEIARLNSYAMPGADGSTNYYGPMEVDTNFDSITDTYRNTGMRIDLSARLTHSSYRTLLMAHELGHTMNLQDCTYCATFTTPMLVGGTAYNNEDDPNLPHGPTACDNTVVVNTAFP